MFLILIIGQVLTHHILDAPIEQIIWCGIDSFLLSSKGTLYKNYLNESAILTQQSGRDNLTLMEILQSPADRSVLYIIGDEDISFVTKNCGKNYTTLHHDRGMHEFKLNSLESRVLMAFKDSRCKNGTLCKEKYKKQLQISQDYGQSWTQVLERVRDAAWDKLIALPEIPDLRIVASHLHQNGSVLVSYSDDFYNTNIPLRWNSYGFYQTNEYLFVLIDADQYSKGYDLEVTKTQKLQLTEIVLPIEDKTKYTFTVLDTVKGSIFISVTHQEDLPKITNIYQSDINGTQYSLSLLNNVRSLDTGSCDFEPILDGVYIANIYENQEYEKIKMRRTTKNTDALKRLENYKQSRITFDRGGEWHSLKAPKYDFKGQPINCNGDCSLHLLGRSEAPRNRIVSHSHIIVATGNTGLYLGNEYNTYLSRDGGHLWFEILSGMHVYEIGENTGVILFINDHEQAKEVLYTWDEGLTFTKIPLNLTIDITSVVFKNQQFLLHGVQDAKTLGIRDDITTSSLRGVVITLDIKNMMVRQCERFEEPGIEDSDYEYWSPTNAAGDKCIFGKKLKYIRRKRNVNCYNNHEDIPEQIESCPCTEEDWECDVGYKKDVNNKCVAMRPTKMPQCRGTFMKSQGYRKIPGDECEGGVNLGPQETECVEEDQVTQVDDIAIKSNKVIDDEEPPVIKQPPKQKYNKTFNQQVEQTEKKGIKFTYLLIGCIFLAISFWIKKKYIDKPKVTRNQRASYFPAKHQEKQSLFSEI